MMLPPARHEVIHCLIEVNRLSAVQLEELNPQIDDNPEVIEVHTGTLCMN